MERATYERERTYAVQAYKDHDAKVQEKREIIQSYIVTTARYDFDVYEKRILYRIVDNMQKHLSGIKLDKKYSINRQLFDLYEVEMPISAFLNNESDNNYGRIKEALLRMQRKVFQYEDNRVWRGIPLIGYPQIRKYDSVITFKLHEDIYDALMNFSKGFKKFELNTAFQFESAYSMRFYELFAKQRTPLNFSIEKLKAMFGVEKKYKLTADFVRWVIEPAKKELDEKSPYSFEYTQMKTGRKITAIRFYPLIIRENADPENEEKTELRKYPQYTVKFKIEKIIHQYLREHYLMSDPEIVNNLELFEMAQEKIPDLLMFLSQVKVKANRAANPKGYLINALKTKLKIKKR
jgi:plasmid replication initiation protein